MGLDEGARARIALTTSCRDAAALPKVAGAGQVADGVQTMYNGVRIVEDCYCGQWMTEIIRDLQGHHEPQEELVFHAIVERLHATDPAPTMLELGANWSFYSLSVLERIPEARAFLVEPDPAFVAVGQANFALNDRVGTFLQAAVSASAAPPQPFVCESDGVTRSVPFESLPSIFEHFGLERADLVLADIQGAELGMLEGARALLESGRVRFLVVSTHHHVISDDPLTHQRCLDLLVDVGAHVIAEHTVAESYSGDGLIAVSFDPRDKDLRVEVSHARVGDSLFGDPLRDLAKCHDELAQVRAELALARAAQRSAEAQRDQVSSELAVVTATRTWRVRGRLLKALRRG
jgi:FkbM family methyltransferase